MSKIDGPSGLNFPHDIVENFENVDGAAVKKLFENFSLIIDSLKDAQDTVPEDDGGPQLPPPSYDLDGADLSCLVLALQTELDETQLQGCKEYIKNNQKKIEAQTKERVKKLMEAAEKSEKADKAGKIGKIIGYIGLALTAVAAISACVATGGLAVGPVACLLFAGGMTVLDETGGMGKILEGMIKVGEKIGLSKKTATWLSVAFIVVVAYFGSKRVPGGAAKIAKGISKLSKGRLVMEEVGKTKVLMTAKAASRARLLKESGQISRTRLMAQRLGETAKYLDDIGTVGGAVAGGVSSYYESDALDLRAQAKDIEKFLTRLQQQLEDEKDRIQEILDKMQSGVSIVMDILRSQTQTQQVIARQSI